MRVFYYFIVFYVSLYKFRFIFFGDYILYMVGVETRFKSFFSDLFLFVKKSLFIRGPPILSIIRKLKGDQDG